MCVILHYFSACRIMRGLPASAGCRRSCRPGTANPLLSDRPKWFAVRRIAGETHARDVVVGYGVSSLPWLSPGPQFQVLRTNTVVKNIVPIGLGLWKLSLVDCYWSSERHVAFIITYGVREEAIRTSQTLQDCAMSEPRRPWPAFYILTTVKISSHIKFGLEKSSGQRPCGRRDVEGLPKKNTAVSIYMCYLKWQERFFIEHPFDG